MKHGTVLAAIATAAFLATTASAAAQDISGMWEVSWESPRGAQTWVMTLEQDGMNLTGTAQTQRGESTISNGMVHGNEVTFTVSVGDGQFTLAFKDQLP